MDRPEIWTVLPYAGASLLSLGVGGGVLLYERFSVSSRRFFALAATMATWLGALAVGYRTTDPGIADLCWRVAAGFQPLSVAALYALTVHLSGSKNRLWARAGWAAAGLWFVVALASPRLHQGLVAVRDGHYGTWNGALGLAAILTVAALAAGAVAELVRGYRRASTRTERRRQLVMLIALGVGALSFNDYFLSPLRFGIPGISSAAITLSIVFLGVAHLRLRAFASDFGFRAEQVLRALGEAVLVCDEDGRIRIANPEAQRLAGASRGAMIGRLVTDFVRTEAGGPPADSAVEFLETTLLSAPGDLDLWLHPLAGPSIPVAVSTEPLRGVSGSRGYVLVARDLRERLASQRALEASELRYRSLFWHNPGLAYEVDLEGRFVQVNPAAEALLGAEPGELIGRTFGEVIAPERLEEAVGVFADVLAGRPLEYDLDVVSLKGERRSIRGMSVPVLVDQQVTGVFGVALDVTEEASAQRELEVQRRYFAELFEASPEAIALISAEGEVRRVNSEFTRLFGYSREEAVGRLLDDLIVPDSDREAAGRLSRMAVDGRLMRAKLVRRRKEGGLVDVSVLARRFQGQDGEPQVYAIYRDMGEQKRTEEKLRSREEELRHAQRLETVGKLAGGIAHDFNNLLTVINGHARFMLDDLAGDSPYREDLEEIEQAGVRAASLTQQLLAFSRRQVLRPQALDLNGVVREMERMLRRLIGSHIRLEAALAPELPTILADRGQIEQVVMNLIVNARDAMPAGGTLTLRTEAVTLEREDRRLGNWDIRPGPYVHLLIEDTGIGMSDELMARAFEPFFTTKERGKGTGLGLSTVFGIVKQSGGHVVARSEPGAGSGFSVYLPAAGAGAGSEEQPTGPADSPEESPAGATILVVEDEAAVRNLAVRVLARHGYTVMSAADGRQALELAGRYPGRIDLVLSDLIMPEVGGRELARRLRLVRPSTRILLMSGYDDEMTGDLEGDDFLPKPFTPAALVERVAALLGAARA